MYVLINIIMAGKIFTYNKTRYFNSNIDIFFENNSTYISSRKM